MKSSSFLGKQSFKNDIRDILCGSTLAEQKWLAMSFPENLYMTQTSVLAAEAKSRASWYHFLRHKSHQLLIFPKVYQGSRADMDISKKGFNCCKAK